MRVDQPTLSINPSKSRAWRIQDAETPRPGPRQGDVYLTTTRRHRTWRAANCAGCSDRAFNSAAQWAQFVRGDRVVSQLVM